MNVHGSRGFTLIEVLISVALSLLILYGVDRVFSITASVIGVGNATMEVNNQIRAAGTALKGDLQGYDYVPTGAMNALPVASTGIYATSFLPLVIMNQQVSAWRDRRDEAGGIPASPPTHRIDTVSFFSHGSFTRQTGDATTSTIAATANDAWIWYGHVMQPQNLNDAGFASLAAFMAQGTTSPANFYPPGGTVQKYAQDWILGRMAILMYPRTNVVGSTNYYIYPQMPYLDRPYSGTTDKTTLAPIWANTPTAENTGPLAADSPYPSSGAWYAPWSLCDVGSLSDSTRGVGEISQALAGWAGTGVDADWWYHLLYRFNCIPEIYTPPPSATPILTTPERMALTIPTLVRGCTDFIVEFAGDFNSDGVTDYYTDTSGIRHIRWYGMPRSDDPTVIALPASAFHPTGTTDVYGNSCDVWAWGPGVTPAPQLLRITIKAVDQNDQLTQPITRQFIFKLR